MNIEERSISANRKAWENAVSGVLRKLDRPGIQCEVEPGMTVDPLYSSDNAPDPIALPVDHIPQPPEVLLSIPSDHLHRIKQDLKDLALDKIHITFHTNEDVQEMEAFNFDNLPYQIQFGDVGLISGISPILLSGASAAFIASAFESSTNGRAFHHDSNTSPSDQLKEIILDLIELANKGFRDTRGLYLLIEIGLNYPVEIAKLRALHILLDHLWSQKDFDLGNQSKPAVQALCVVAETEAGLPEKGLIEMTTKCMAASAGVVHGIVLAPSYLDYSHSDLLYGHSMIPRILQHESDWYRTKDPMVGSYWIEKVTRRLAETAWAKVGKAKRGN